MTFAERSQRQRIQIGLQILLVGIVCSLHQWSGLVATRGQYTPFSVSPFVSAITFDETHAYAPPVRHFMASGKLPAEVDEYEHRAFNAGIPFVPIVVLGALGKFAGSLERVFILSDFVFPACLFGLLYWMSRDLVESQWLRMLVAWSSILIPLNLKDALWIGIDATIDPLEITRTPQPEITFLLLLVAAAFVGRALKDEAGWAWTILATLASGVVVYCYYFYAISWGIALVLGFFISLAIGERAAGLRIGLVLLGTALLSIPFALTTLRGQRESGQTYLLGRMGVYTHRIDLPALLGGCLLVIVFLIGGRRLWNSSPLSFVLGLLVAGSLFGMNIQLLTGYETQPWHFWKRLALPVCFFVAMTWLGRFAERRFNANNQRVSAFARVALALIILNAAARQIYAGVKVSAYQRSDNPEVTLLTWIEKNVPRESVVATVDPDLILLLPTFTDDYTYVPSGLRSLTSTQEIVGRYISLGCTMDLSPQRMAEDAAIPNHRGASTKILHVLGLSYTGEQHVLRSLIDEYRQGYQACRTPQGRMDYVVLPPGDPVSLRLRSAFPSWRLIYRNSRYELIALKAESAKPLS